MCFYFDGLLCDAFFRFQIVGAWVGGVGMEDERKMDA
jgi:hypothetical protein